MKQLTKAFLIIILSLSGASGCSALSPFKVAVLQGNIIEDKDVEQLVKGLTKDQVQYLLGTPLLNSPIHPMRWDYFYSVKVGDIVVGEKKLTLKFDSSEKLESWILEEESMGNS
ncbi:MAG: outer membrane protein assembly factor BamE [SAR86 cluster bacterium]|jgi:outer membrane protein assembly factor BamE|nr:outer membrane protein assembly factor BamE [Gammaproteobacteria bacterium]MDC0485313.1 outer membrane protein assembly factor BamE [Gammaproteobacteria bacterium]MDG0966134.1 outer membrane protein assembly factor BamE [SAR86 cluster bacterium]MDG2347229.1 outer membrane protein assembly factor BamE [SAR86 cluster bacterium]|tara:strand:- start:985 stop:1326 length:342 start_codon:yes stop_codon:yes gene_type:complete